VQIAGVRPEYKYEYGGKLSLSHNLPLPGMGWDGNYTGIRFELPRVWSARKGAVLQLCLKYMKQTAAEGICQETATLHKEEVNMEDKHIW